MVCRPAMLIPRRARGVNEITQYCMFMSRPAGCGAMELLDMMPVRGSYRHTVDQLDVVQIDGHRIGTEIGTWPDVPSARLKRLPD